MSIPKKLGLTNYKCAHCEHAYKAVGLGDFCYGEFILQSNGGAERYLDALSDTTYGEVDEMLKAHPLLAENSALQIAKLLQSIYGAVACDPDDEGNCLIVGNPPKCPNCAAQVVVSWDATDPMEFSEVETMLVTHRLWNSLRLLFIDRLHMVFILDHLRRCDFFVKIDCGLFIRMLGEIEELFLQSSWLPSRLTEEHRYQAHHAPLIWFDRLIYGSQGLCRGQGRERWCCRAEF